MRAVPVMNDHARIVVSMPVVITSVPNTTPSHRHTHVCEGRADTWHRLAVVFQMPRIVIAYITHNDRQRRRNDFNIAGANIL